MPDNALTIPRDPTVLVSPLAAMDAGTKSAGLVYDLRQQQANEAAGQAYQGAINPQTGEFDPNEFRRRLAASGPAAMAAGHELANTQQISSDQLKQNFDKAKWVNSTAGALLLQGDFSDAAMLGALHNGVAGGILTLPEAQRQLATMPADAAGRQRWLEEHRDTSASWVEQTERQYGTRHPTQFGGGTVFPTVPAAGRGDAPIVLQTLTPEQRNATVDLKDPRKTLPDGSPNPDFGKPKTFTRQEQLEMNGFTVLPDGRVIPPAGGGVGGTGLGDGRYSNMPPALRRPNASPAASTPPASNASPAPNTSGAPAIQFGDPNQPQAVPAPPGSSAPAGPYTGGGMGTILGPRSDAAPAPNANVAMILQGMQNARVNPLGGSAMTAGPGAPTTPTVAATPEAGWGTAPGTYDTAPTSPAPMARPAVAPPPAQRSPFDRPAMGLSSTEEEQLKAAGPQFNAEINAGTQAQTQQALLGNMLVDTKQFLPGPWAETWKNIRARLAPAFNVNDTALAGAENFDKAAAQLANAQGAGSDSRMSVNIAANPHGGMSAPGVDLAIRQLQGNADYIQARAKLAQQWPNADYNGFVASARQLDPRVFQYERMTGGQRSDYLDALSPKDARAFMAAHKWAEGKGLISR